MITCKECQHENMVGSVICAGCGKPLDSGGNAEAEPVVSVSKAPDLLEHGSLAGCIESHEKNWVTVVFLDNGETLPLALENELTMGRSTDGDHVNPEIDLTPYQALAHGVSRLHLALKRESNGVAIKDLGSSNGTYLNGRRLKPQVIETLKHGDIVVLSKMQIQILLHEP